MTTYTSIHDEIREEEKQKIKIKLRVCIVYVPVTCFYDYYHCVYIKYIVVIVYPLFVYEMELFEENSKKGVEQWFCFFENYAFFFASLRRA